MIEIQLFKGKRKLKQPLLKSISLSIGDCGPVIRGIQRKRKPNKGMFHVLNSTTIKTYLKGRPQQTGQVSWFCREAHCFDSNFAVSM